MQRLSVQTLMGLLGSAYGLFLKMGRLLGLLILLRMLVLLSNYRRTVQTGRNGAVHGLTITVVRIMERILVRALMHLCHLGHKKQEQVTMYSVRHLLDRELVPLVQPVD